MIFESEVFVRDTVKLNVLKELLSGNMTLAVQLNDGTIENYATQIHNAMGRVRVYGNFNMSESVDGETLTIRPISIDGTLKAVPALSKELSEKSILLVRSATKKEENRYPFDSTFLGMEFVPSGDRYIMRLEYADSTPQEEAPVIQEEVPVIQEEIPVVQEEAPVIQEEIPVVQEEAPVIQEEIPVVQEEVPVIQEEIPVVQEQPKPEPPKDNKWQKIEEECRKDYSDAQTEVQEYQNRLEIDKRILEYYQDKDFKPIEEILKEIGEKLNEAEKQIALFIEAKQKKTMEIEGEIKSNK